jgi:TRAP-type mannitol/chloroaromatic compound transport system permease small subunit
MNQLLSLSRAIDALNTWIGRAAAWLVLAAVVISAGNAMSRKFFSVSSNAWLELQWYLFGAVFMLGAAWTLKLNEHVRIDIVSSRLSKRTRDRLDIVGHLIFLLPFVLLHINTATPFFLGSYQSGEVSTNAGGLIIWPAKLMILIGFVLLLLQGLSELIKRIAIVRGIIPDDAVPASHAPPSAPPTPAPTP